MKTWATNLIISSFIFTILVLILPNGKISKTVKTTFGMIMILLVFNPIISLKNINININDFLVFSNFQVQTNYLEYLYQEKAKSLEINCECIAEQLGIKMAEFNIVYTMGDKNQFNVEYAQMNLENAVINSENEHIIIIDKVKKNVSEYLNIDYKCVVVYE